jgi:hypothetical protein
MVHRGLRLENDSDCASYIVHEPILSEFYGLLFFEHIDEDMRITHDRSINMNYELSSWASICLRTPVVCCAHDPLQTIVPCFAPAVIIWTPARPTVPCISPQSLLHILVSRLH